MASREEQEDDAERLFLSIGLAEATAKCENYFNCTLQ